MFTDWEARAQSVNVGEDTLSAILLACWMLKGVSVDAGLTLRTITTHTLTMFTLRTKVYPIWRWHFKNMAPFTHCSILTSVHSMFI